MSRTCTVCQHPERELIDGALVNGQASYRGIAGQYGLTKSSVERHAAEHLPQALAKAQEAGEMARADDLLAQARSLQARALSILDAAEASGALVVALSAIREVRGVIELLARLLATVQATSTRAQQEPLTVTDIIMSAGYQELTAWIDRELSDQQRISFAALMYPEGYIGDPKYGPNAPDRDRSLDTWKGHPLGGGSNRARQM